MGNEIFYFCPMLKNHRLDRILLREGCVIPKKEAICPKVTRWKMEGTEKVITIQSSLRII